MDQEPPMNVVSPYVDGTCVDKYVNADDGFLRIVCKVRQKSTSSVIMECGTLRFFAIHRSAEHNMMFLEKMTEGNIYEFIGLMTRSENGSYQMEVSHFTIYNRGFDMEQYPNLVKLWHNPKYRDIFFPKRK